MTDGSAPTPIVARNSVALGLKAGRVRLSGRLRLSTGGIVAVAALVSATLLSTAALVQVATATPRARPGLALLRARR